MKLPFIFCSSKTGGQKCCLGLPQSFVHPARGRKSLRIERTGVGSVTAGRQIRLFRQNAWGRATAPMMQVNDDYEESDSATSRSSRNLRKTGRSIMEFSFSVFCVASVAGRSAILQKNPLYSVVADHRHCRYGRVPPAQHDLHCRASNHYLRGRVMAVFIFIGDDGQCFRRDL